MIDRLRYIAIRSLISKPLRTFLTILGVAFGLSLWIAVKAINRSTLDAFKTNIEAVTGKAQLTANAGEMAFDESKVDVIKNIPGVAHAVPMIVSKGYFAGVADTSKTLMIFGVDMLKEQGVRTYRMTDEEIIEDPLVFLNQPDSIILTHEFAKANGFKIDSKIELATAAGKKTFTVRGLLTPDGPAKAYGGAIALMDIDGARYTFGKDGKVDRVDIVLKEGVDIEKTRELLSKTLGPAIEVLRPEGQTAEAANVVRSFQVMLEFFSTIALVVGVFMVTNSVGISVAERRREIGTLRALGATRAMILGSFLFESALIGTLGAALGSFFGKIMAVVLIKDVTTSLASQHMMQIQTPTLHFGQREILFGFFIGIFSSIAAAFWPAYQATKIEPLAAIRLNDNASLNVNQKIWSTSTTIGIVLLILTAIYTFAPKDFSAPALESLNLVFSVAGAALFSPFLVNLLLLALKPMLTRGTSAHATVTRLSSDNLLRNPKRTTSNIAILMVGLSFVILVSAVNISFRNTLINWVQRAIYSDFLVSANGNLMQLDVQSTDEKIADELAAVPGVRKDHRGKVFCQRVLRFRYEGETVTIKAGDEPIPELKYAHLITKDRPAFELGNDVFHSADPSLAISEGFAKSFNKKTGDFLKLNTPSGPIDFRVAGIYVDFANPKGVLYISREVFKKYWKDHLVTMYAIKAMPGVTPAELRARVESTVAKKYNLMLVSNKELLDQMVVKIDESFVFMHTVEIAALLVALLGILNTLMVSVMERTREIGLLRAVGMSGRQVFTMILLEALVQGTFGAVIAIFIGTWIAYSWMQKSLSQIVGWVIDFYFPWNGIGLVFVAGILVALAAGVFPSRKASKIDIREALDYE